VNALYRRDDLYVILNHPYSWVTVPVLQMSLFVSLSQSPILFLSRFGLGEAMMLIQVALIGRNLCFEMILEAHMAVDRYDNN
jgi:hypothetical protein